MSTTIVNVPDRENSTSTQMVKRGGKQSMGLTVRNSNSNGGSHGHFKPTQKVLSGSLPTSQRSFGDISNRIGLMNDTCQGAVKKNINYPDCVPSSIPKRAPDHLDRGTYEPEFFPEIKEVEDYTDVLPSPYQLTSHHINKLVRFWEVCRKPEMSTLDPSHFPSSPPRSLSLMPTVKEKAKRIILEPVHEDLFDLPPPAWE